MFVINELKEVLRNLLNGEIDSEILPESQVLASGDEASNFDKAGKEIG
jgi:hypothetical protein